MSDPPKPSGFKLKFGAPKPPSEAPAPSPAATTPGGTGLKLSFKPKSAANTPVSETAPAFPSSAKPATQPQQPKKRKYTKKEKTGEGSSAAAAAAPAAAGPAAPKQSKKRAREDNGGVMLSTAKKPKPSLSLQTPNSHPPPGPQRNPSISLKLKTGKTPKTPAVTRIKVKHVGQPPKREPGVGYDSEAEDAEVDPTIESQFVLRMAPGPDCDYLRKAVTERRVGLSLKEGGANVHFRFFDKEGRRACVVIQGRHYAACMVDLPCVIEGMKSWERKSGWYKTGDICQMMVVHTKVDSEEEAKNAPLPREVDGKTWQYPHGLTPPMHYVRKRRFRKRVSTRTIEAVEEEVERLLAMDEKAAQQGGSCTYDLIDPNRPDRDDASSQVGDEDAMGEYVDAEGFVDADADAEGDDDELLRMMEAEMAGHEDQPITSIEGPGSAISFDAAAHAVAQHALTGDSGIPSSAIVGTPVTETPVATPGASASAEPETEQEDDEEDDEDEEEDEIDEAAAAQQEMKAQLREEVADLEREVENAKQQMDRQQNPLLKQRLQAKFKSLQSDLELKKASLGDDDDE